MLFRSPKGTPTLIFIIPLFVKFCTCFLKKYLIFLNFSLLFRRTRASFSTRFSTCCILGIFSQIFRVKRQMIPAGTICLFRYTCCTVPCETKNMRPPCTCASFSGSQQVMRTCPFSMRLSTKSCRLASSSLSTSSSSRIGYSFVLS